MNKIQKPPLLRLLLASAALSLGASTLPPAYAAPFQDTLDATAHITPQALSGMLTAVTRAGDRLVAVGPHGRILVSEDQGKQWRQVPAPTSVDLVAVHFPAARKGWAVGHGAVVLHSTDGGLTWKKQFDGAQAAAAMKKYYEPLAAQLDAKVSAAIRQFEREGPIHPFLDVWFENEQTGYVVGPFNLIFRTEDGGAGWTPWIERTDNPKAMNLNAVRGAGGEVYIAGEQGLLLKLDRAKQRFVALPQPYNGTYFGLVVTPQALVVFGMRGNIYRSTDGGKTWQKSDAGGEGNGLNAGALLDDGRIVIVSMTAGILVSTDDGAHFSRLPASKPIPLFGVAPAGKQGVAVVGIRGTFVEALKP